MTSTRIRRIDWERVSGYFGLKEPPGSYQTANHEPGLAVLVGHKTRSTGSRKIPASFVGKEQVAYQTTGPTRQIVASTLADQSCADTLAGDGATQLRRFPWCANLLRHVVRFFACSGRTKTARVGDCPGVCSGAERLQAVEAWIEFPH